MRGTSAFTLSLDPTGATAWADHLAGTGEGGHVGGPDAVAEQVAFLEQHIAERLSMAQIEAAP